MRHVIFKTSSILCRSTLVLRKFFLANVQNSGKGNVNVRQRVAPCLTGYINGLATTHCKPIGLHNEDAVVERLQKLHCNAHSHSPLDKYLEGCDTVHRQMLRDTSMCRLYV